MNYARRNGLKIINLYFEQDKPFYGMTQEEMFKQWEILSEKVLNKKQPEIKAKQPHYGVRRRDGYFI